MASQETQRAGFVRGLRTCAEMLGSMDLDECAIAGMSVLSTRRGRPQDNAVLRVLSEVITRGDSAELEGFCAALTDLAATADEHGDFCRMFGEMADTQAVAHG